MAEEIRKGEAFVGYAGEIRPEVLGLWDLEHPVYYAELFLDAVEPHRAREQKVKALARFPFTERDLAIVVNEEVKAGQIMQEIRSRGEGLISRVDLFDLFRGGRIPKGKKSLAFRILYQSEERTLRSEEAQDLHRRIADSLVSKYQATFQ